MKIETESEFDAKLDEYGELLATIKRLEVEADLLKQIIELYATERKIHAHSTDKYRLRMVKGVAALRRAAGVREADVVAALKRSEVFSAFLCETYDGAAIKDYVKGLADADETLAALGLTLTEPKRHAEVKPQHA